jgi:hypothetical protein
MMESKESYLGNPLIKRDGIVQQWDKTDLTEYIKCSKDPVYFAKNYVKVIHVDRGLVPFDLYPYQEDMFKHFKNNRFSIVLACRQSGKSISSIAYLLWYILFHSEKTVAILANKGATAREMLARMTLMLENIPFFLQPGCKAVNKGSLEFSNNSKVIAAATSASSIRGFSANIIMLDEFAFVERAAEFYASTYPVISSGKNTQVIITSTANGVGNQFYKIWESAMQGTSDFKPFRVDWWDVPGRDKEWKRLTVSNTSELQFQIEFGNTFHGTGDTLITADTLLNLKAHPPMHILDSGVRIYEEVDQSHEYIMLCDVGRGIGQDYSTFNIIDISTKPFKQVVTYRNNTISPLLFPNIIYKIANLYKECLVVVESNDHGIVVCNALYYDLEYENLYIESAVKADKLGVLMTKKVKRIGCSTFKELLEQNKLEIVDEHTIMEITTFEARGNSFEASNGNHDDLVMNFIMFGYFAGTNFFNELTDMNLKDILYSKRLKEIEDGVVPFGFIDDGSTNITTTKTSNGNWLFDETDKNF